VKDVELGRLNSGDSWQEKECSKVGAAGENGRRMDRRAGSNKQRTGANDGNKKVQSCGRGLSG
jgi:hypothetical protein